MPSLVVLEMPDTRVVPTMSLLPVHMSSRTLGPLSSGHFSPASLAPSRTFKDLVRSSVSSHEIVPFVALRFYFILASIDLLQFTMCPHVMLMNGRLIVYSIAQYQRDEGFRLDVEV